MTTTETPSRLKRRLRYLLITLAACALTIALFYAEEDLRGWRAMEKCKRELVAEGVNRDWKSYIPAPVPEDENVFGVPEMQNAFTGHGERYLTKNWPNPERDGTARMVIAQLTIGLPGATPPAGSAVVPWGDLKASGEETVRLIKEAIGPVAMNPAGGFYPKQPPEDIRTAQIFFQCQTEPNEKDVQSLVPDSIFNSWDQYEKLKVERTGDGTYNVTMLTPVTAAEFLKLNKPIEPQFDMIRKALQRPYARMNGDYNEPAEIPIPNFVIVRNISQRLGALAQCHFLLDQPDEALRDLTLTDDICRRILEENKPMTLVSAMINVAVRGLDASVIADGLKRHAWREPQLAALEQQLKPINILGPVKQAFGLEREECFVLETKTPAQLTKMYILYGTDHKANSWGARYTMLIAKLIPRGWAYQNIATCANIYSHSIALVDPASQLISPDKTQAYIKQMNKVFSHWSPYNFLASIAVPNFSRACHTTAKNQTEVNQARIACALERYRLAHGDYPETLDALIPQFIDVIPHDVIGGQPPHYSRNADGTFLLYSIGWSQKDHGGHAGDKDDDDLVWPPEN